MENLFLLPLYLQLYKLQLQQINTGELLAPLPRLGTPSNNNPPPPF